MTDSSSTILPDTAALAAQPAADFLSSSTHEHAAPSKPTVASEDQDYTIKCLCGLTIEEQGTICCEKCETWQHTECYYTDKNGEVPSDEALQEIQHLCIDCHPRSLDTKSAIERQRLRVAEYELDEKRRQKAPSKSHKKKIKVSDTNGAVLNGFAHNHDVDGTVAHHDRTSRSPLGNVPPSGKRSKNGHRSTHSTNLPPQPQYLQAHKRSASAAQSPTKIPLKAAQIAVAAPAAEREICSAAFVHLYDNDPGDSDLQTNLLNDLQITNKMKLWSNDLEALHEAAPTFSHTQIFQRTEKPVKSMQMAELHKQERVSEDFSVDDQHPKWRYLTVDAWTQEGSLVAEIKGKIGHMSEYTKDPDNRWDYLRHPEPFVFFHRHLPIYIDTRSEGTTCRYLRRSCIPNLEMKTFLENDSEYHFCFVASKDIEPNSELTIGWTTDEHMRRILTELDNGVKEEELAAEQVEYMADWSSKVLLEFGGCACDGTNCAMTKRSKRVNMSKASRNGYSSTNSNAGYRFNNSRDGSEQFEARSTSESKSGSRDMTPIENHVDSPFGTEISAREKRKIAALDKKFERLEEKPAAKKKKRNSGGSSVSTPVADNSKRLALPPSASQPNTPGLLLSSSKPQYADASTSHRQSGSPVARTSNNPSGRPKSSTTTVGKGKTRSSMPSTPHRPSPLFRVNYVSQGTQTDPVVDGEDDWTRASQPPTPVRKPFMSLTKRLLLRSQHERQMLEQRRSASNEPQRTTDADALPSNCNPPHPPPTTATAAGASEPPQQDVEMTDVDPALPSTTKFPGTPSTSLANLHIQESSSSAVDGEAKPPLPPPPSLSLPLQDPSAQSDRPPLLPPAPATAPPLLPNGLHTPDLENNPPQTSDSSANPSTAEAPAPPIPQPQPPPLSRTHTQSSLPSTAPPLPPANPTTIAQPSPVTKKLSLSEYFSKRKSSSNAGDTKSTGSPEMTQGAFKPPAPLTNGDNKTNNNGATATVETTAPLVDSPMEQRVADPPLETVPETKDEEEDIS